MKLFSRDSKPEAAPAQTHAEPTHVTVDSAEPPQYVTKEHFDAVVDALLVLIAEAAYTSESGGFGEDGASYRFSRNKSVIYRRAMAALDTVNRADQRVQNERARRQRFG